jgi:hypothetical protein
MFLTDRLSWYTICDGKIKTFTKCEIDKQFFLIFKDVLTKWNIETFYINFIKDKTSDSKSSEHKFISFI